MKKLVSALICVLLIATLTLTVFGTDTAQITITAAVETAQPGETVAFSAVLSDMEDCRSAGIVLAYDQAVFEFVEGSCALKNVLLADFKDGTGVFTFGGARAVSGEIFTFRLKVKDDAPEGSCNIAAKGSVRNGQGAIDTTVKGFALVIAKADEQPSQPSAPVVEQEKETQPAPTETTPKVPVVPEKNETTAPTQMPETQATTSTESVAPETEATNPTKGMQSVQVEQPVYTIGAEEEAPKAFPWWIWILVAVLGIGAAVTVILCKKK